MSEHEYEKYTEKEEAVVEGVDISGIWNRMYEPRELTGYDLTFMDKVRAGTAPSKVSLDSAGPGPVRPPGTQISHFFNRD